MNTQPAVMAATDYPLHGDGFRAYLRGFYEVEILHCLSGLEAAITRLKPVAVIVDSTFDAEPQLALQRIKMRLPACGFVYVDAVPHILKVLACLEHGFSAYLHISDCRMESLRLAVDLARQQQRYLSPGILALYEHYNSYRGLFNHLPAGLTLILKLMVDGLTISQMATRTGLSHAVIYRRQYRLRLHFGVETNADLLKMMHGLVEDQDSPQAAYR